MTYKEWLNFVEESFRYGSPTKVVLGTQKCSELLASAREHYGHVEDMFCGTKIVTPHGTLILPDKPEYFVIQ